MAGELPVAVLEAAAAAARAHARAEAGTDGTGVWRDAAAAAIDVAEAFLGVRLIARDLEERVAGGSGWRMLGGLPVEAITEAVGPDGALAPGEWVADVDAEGRGWVCVGRGVATVAYRAGLAASWDGLPAGVRQGVAVLAAHLLAERGGMAPPAAVAALWRPHRRLRLTEARSTGARSTAALSTGARA